MDHPETFSNRYLVLSILGEGGMGTVYRVADRHDGMRELALKTIKHDGAVTPEQQLRFRDEFRAMAKLRHPNTIEVFDFGQVDAACLFITMELVPGRELTEIMAGRPMPYVEIYPVLIQLLQALHFIHSRHFVHRDIKSQNIRVREDGCVKLMDFGLMGQLGQQSSRTVTGSPGYLAPEVALGGAIEASSDLYSVGCLAYEMITGRLPFDGTLAQVVRGHISEKPALPSTLRADVPERLERIVMKMLEKEQVRRFRTAAEVIDELSALAGVAVAFDSLEQARSYLTTSQIVGRDQELQQLHAISLEALEGKGRAVMLTAPAGTGKSRLMQELVLKAKLNDVAVLHGECVETGMAPYEALANGLRPGLAHGTAEERDRHIAALKMLFPDFVKDLPYDGPALEPEELANATLEWLQSVSGRRPLLLLVEDLHWADPQTLTVLNHCIRNLGDHRILVVGTFRSDEVPPGSPVWYTLEEGSATELRLGPLTPEAQMQLVEAMLVDPYMTDEFAQALYGATGGNAFFLTEVLRALMEAGLLARRGGRWRFPTEAAALDQLDSIESTLRRRLAGLGREARRLASVAAVLGRRQSLVMLQAITGMMDDELFEAIDELLDRQFLLREIDGFAFPHDRVRETLYDRQEPTIRRTLHQRAGEYFEARGAQTAHQLHEMAYHFSRGVDTTRAYRYLMQAAAQADATGADATALDLWMQADRALETAVVDAKLDHQMRLWSTIGQNAFVLQPLDGITALSKLATAADRLSPERFEALTGHPPGGMYVMLAAAQGFAGLARDALASAEKAIAASPHPSEVELGIHEFTRCTGLMAQGHYDEAIALGQRAQRHLETIPLEVAPLALRGPRVGCRTIQNLTFMQGYRPDPKLRDEALVISEYNGDPRPFTVLMPFGVYAVQSGRFEETVAYLEEAVQKCRRTGSPPYPYMLYVRAHLHWQRGDLAGALAYLDKALSYPNVAQMKVAACLLRVLRGAVLVDLGRLEEARAELGSLLAEAQRLELGHFTMLARIGLGLEALARSDAEAAREPLTLAYRDAEEGPLRNPGSQMEAGRALARLALLDRDLARARRLAEEALAIVERPEIDNPLEQAHCHRVLADVAKARGDREMAKAALARAGDLYHTLRNPHWLHAVTRQLEELTELSARVPQEATPGEASVETRWKFLRGAMM